MLPEQTNRLTRAFSALEKDSPMSDSDTDSESRSNCSNSLDPVVQNDPQSPEEDIESLLQDDETEEQDFFADWHIDPMIADLLT